MTEKFPKMYYAENPDAAHDIHELAVVLLGQKMSFLTDSGVFSKKAIDFGSQLLLKSVEFSENSTLLDLGCGYGPIGLTLAKVQKVLPTMTDVNLRALALAEKNALKNDISVDIFQSNLYENVTGTFDNIVSNPPIRAGKEIVHGVISGAFEYLKPNGTLTIVIQKKQGAPSAKAKMIDVFGNCDVIKKDKGYFILQSARED
ncbi:16S rRNA methyltransferase [Lactococcus hodotermopsidis]|uniref:16S rRNA methyltransferase n=1 Tax=Pseudolactococcus hodotermopsidis TaxID=2709157 RepID=A0A6A0B8W0_9LACT|nr:class I SAM-dependent methyltransferase [Lactococcus hodotermopsidis]GFH41860.1 16S rRNA methyltransferase [Lactococcus hodotermopsidis]